MQSIKLNTMATASKSIINGIIAIGVIFPIGIILTAFSQSILHNLEVNPSGLFAVMMMLFIFKILPFVPFLIIVYFLCRFLITRLSVYLTMIVVIVLFFAYGYLIWNGEFLHTYQFDRPNYSFHRWLASEARDWHFSIASFISTLLFVWMTFYKKGRTATKLYGTEENTSTKIRT